MVKMKSLLRLTDFTKEEIYQIFKIANDIKEEDKYHNILKGIIRMSRFVITNAHTIDQAMHDYQMHGFSIMCKYWDYREE